MNVNLSFGLVFCVLSFALSALAEGEGVTLQHRPENIAKGYHVVSLLGNNGAKDKKDQRFDLPIIRSSGGIETVETTAAMDLTTIMTRGLPLHLPSTAVGVNSTWDGWSEVNTFIIHHVYTLGNTREIAGRMCAEVSYKLQAVQKTPDGGAAQDQNVVAGDGRFLFDLNNGVVVVHTWQLNGGGLKADYAAALNL